MNTAQTTEANLLNLLKTLWAAKRPIIIGAIIGMVSALLFVAFAKPHYKASMIISPASPMNSAQLSSLLANDNLFAIRHLLQGNANTGEFQSFEHIIHGQNIAKIFLQNDTIRKGVQIDLKYGALGLGTLRKPDTLSPAILSEYMRKHVKIQPVPNSAFRQLTYNHPSPEFAAFMLQELHKIADIKLRTKTNETAATRIQYLQNAIMKTRNPEHRRALTTLLMEQERLKMLSSIEQPYAASIIEPAAASAKPEFPRKSILYSLLPLCGALCGFLFYSITKPYSTHTQPGHNTQHRSSAKFRNWLKGSSNDSKNNNAPYKNKRNQQDAAE